MRRRFLGVWQLWVGQEEDWWSGLPGLENNFILDVFHSLGEEVGSVNSSVKDIGEEYYSFL